MQHANNTFSFLTYFTSIIKAYKRFIVVVCALYAA